MASIAMLMIPVIRASLFAGLIVLASPPIIAAERLPLPRVMEPVPLPLPRPAALNEWAGRDWPRTMPGTTTTALAPLPEVQPLELPPLALGPTACEMRLESIASFKPLPVLVGPGACGATDVVRLDAIHLPDRKVVAMNPPATLRCDMAEAVARWIREDIVPASEAMGSPVVALTAYDSYECRGRNRVVGAKLSEHGKANAIDVKGVRLANGRILEWTAVAAPKDYRDKMRTVACGRFNTVLGPGSDGYHEEHIHVDLAQRSRGYKMCQWDVRDPGAMAAVPAMEVPLPLPRPTAFTGPERQPL